MSPRNLRNLPSAHTRDSKTIAHNLPSHRCKLDEDPKSRSATADRLRYVGTWLSLVEHSLGVRGVGSSNLPVPTIRFQNNFQKWQSTRLASCLFANGRRPIGSSAVCLCLDIFRDALLLLPWRGCAANGKDGVRGRNLREIARGTVCSELDIGKLPTGEGR